MPPIVSQMSHWLKQFNPLPLSQYNLLSKMPKPRPFYCAWMFVIYLKFANINKNKDKIAEKNLQNYLSQESSYNSTNTWYSMKITELEWVKPDNLFMTLMAIYNYLLFLNDVNTPCIALAQLLGYLIWEINQLLVFLLNTTITISKTQIMLNVRVWFHW